MKKIKNMSHLRTEKKRLARRRSGLEDSIHNDWHSLRHDLEPAAMARDAFFSGLGTLTRRIFSTEGRFRPFGRRHSNS